MGRPAAPSRFSGSAPDYENLADADGTLYFAVGYYTSVNLNQLWRSDGTTVSEVGDFGAEFGGAPGGMTYWNGVVYFAAGDNAELWQANAATNAIAPVLDGNGNPILGVSDIVASNDANNTLSFTASDPAARARNCGRSRRPIRLPPSSPSSIPATPGPRRT